VFYFIVRSVKSSQPFLQLASEINLVLAQTFSFMQKDHAPRKNQAAFR